MSHAASALSVSLDSTWLRSKLFRNKLPARYLPFNQIAAGIKRQHHPDGPVTTLLADQNFTAKVSSYTFPFTVLGTQIVDHVYPCSDLAAAVAPYSDPE